MKPAELPYWMKIVEALGPTIVALVALVVAAIAGLITYRQWRTTHDTLRLGLFKKRYAIFEATMTILAETVSRGTVTSNEIRQWYRSIKGAEFLFSKKIVEYLRQLRQELEELESKNLEIDENSGYPCLKCLIDQSRDMKDRIERHFKTGLRNEFKDYLDFGHLK